MKDTPVLFANQVTAAQWRDTFSADDYADQLAKSLDYSRYEPQFQQPRDYTGVFAGLGSSIKWTNPDNYEERTRRLYWDCSVSRACVDIRAEHIASVPVVCERGNADSQLLITSPNTVDGTLSQALRVWETSLALGGDLFLFLDRSVRGRPQLWTLRQDKLRQDPRAGTVEYGNTVNGRFQPEYRFFTEAGVCTGAQQRTDAGWTTVAGSLLHIMAHNPLSSAQGSGAGDAVLRAVDTWIHAYDLVAGRFRAGGRANGFVRAPNLQSDDEIAQFKAVMSQLQTRNEVSVLASGADWVNNQLSFTELDVVRILATLTRTIANGFSVPAVMMNLEGESSYANVRGADRIFYTGWVKPRAEWLISQLELFLRRDLDPTIQLGIDETRLPYMRDDQQETAKVMHGLGSFTANEIRAVMGYDAIDGGDELPSAKPAAQPEPDTTAQDEGEQPAKPREVAHNADSSRRPSEKRLSALTR